MQALVSHIKSPRRTVPICVVAIPSGKEEPLFDLNQLKGEFENLVEFAVVQTGPLTREFQESMPEHCHVFGTAARAYRHDFHEIQKAGKLHYGEPIEGLEKATAAITGELWGYVNAAGLLKPAATTAKTEEAEVVGTVGRELALLRRSNGEMVQVYVERQFPGVPVAAILRVGQKVLGHMEENSRNFLIDAPELTDERLQAAFPLGSVTLGLVVETNRKAATVALHPNRQFLVPKARITHNELDVISEYLDEGQVYSFRVFRDDHGKIQLRCDDIDDFEDVLPALSILAGGEPWLNEEVGLVGAEFREASVELVVEDTQSISLEQLDAQIQAEYLAEGTAAQSERTVTEAKPSAGDNLGAFTVNYYRGTILAMQATENRLRDLAEQAVEERREALQELAKLTERHNALKSEHAGLKKSLRAAGKKTEVNPWDSLEHFEDYPEWLAWELQKAWIENYPPADRQRFPLDSHKWSFGTQFFSNFSQELLNEVQLRKAIRTILDLVTGRAREQRNMEFHPLTEDGANQHMRGQDKGMRAYIEEETAGARRLHYWQKPGGFIELSNIVTHDTYTIYR